MYFRNDHPMNLARIGLRRTPALPPRVTAVSWLDPKGVDPVIQGVSNVNKGMVI